MHPSSHAKSTEFSPCSISEICSNLATAECLEEPSSLKLFTGQQCGNGVKEGSEECDCGNEVQCADNPCCNTNCTLKKGAQCYDGNGPCCKDCLIVERNKLVCRNNTSLCDVEERCDGVSIACPSNLFREDGSACGDGLSCASGQCTSRDLQCKILAKRFLSLGECSTSSKAECEMICSASSSCIKLANYYLDGTPCQSGKCYAGECRGNSVLDFVQDNKFAIIGSVTGLSLLFIVATICIYKKKKFKSINLQ